jgi:hypothetical protein
LFPDRKGYLEVFALFLVRLIPKLSFRELWLRSILSPASAFASTDHFFHLRRRHGLTRLFLGALSAALLVDFVSRLKIPAWFGLGMGMDQCLGLQWLRFESGCRRFLRAWTMARLNPDSTR